MKTVGIFAQVPDDILAEVASLLTEVPIQAGTPIFAQGALGDSMYIVVAGSVEIHAQDQVIDRIDERGIFGEMALLDAAPRMASATADSDGLLLRLDQAPFAELMADHTEVPTGIIRVLSQRLRDRVDDIRSLQACLAATK